MCNRSPRMTPTAPRSGCRRPEDTTMRTTPTPALAGLLALLALPCVARADTMGEIPVGRTGVTGTIVAEGETQTWTVQRGGQPPGPLRALGDAGLPRRRKDAVPGRGRPHAPDHVFRL